jgi:hypothetical protein
MVPQSSFRKDSLKMVFLKKEIGQQTADDTATRVESADWSTTTAHIGILLVDACDARQQSILFLVLIWDIRLGFDVSMDDFKPTFVVNAVAIPERGRHRNLANHTQESARIRRL